VVIQEPLLDFAGLDEGVFVGRRSSRRLRPGSLASTVHALRGHQLTRRLFLRIGEAALEHAQEKTIGSSDSIPARRVRNFAAASRS